MVSSESTVFEIRRWVHLTSPLWEGCRSQGFGHVGGVVLIWIIADSIHDIGQSHD